MKNSIVTSVRLEFQNVSICSPLVAVIFEGGVSQITIGVGQNLTLNPEALSIDPDDPDGLHVSTSNILFQWPWPFHGRTEES